MEAFPAEDRAKDVRDLDLGHDSLPAQQSLGVFCNLEMGAFTFKGTLPEKLFTRRGVLSTVNSLYDPRFCSASQAQREKDTPAARSYGSPTSKNNTPLPWDDSLPEAMMNR